MCLHHVWWQSDITFVTMGFLIIEKTVKKNKGLDKLYQVTFMAVGMAVIIPFPFSYPHTDHIFQKIVEKTWHSFKTWNLFCFYNLNNIAKGKSIVCGRRSCLFFWVFSPCYLFPNLLSFSSGAWGEKRTKNKQTMGWHASNLNKGQLLMERKLLKNNSIL